MLKLNFEDKIYIEFDEWLDEYDLLYLKEYEKWKHQKKYSKDEEFEKLCEKEMKKKWLFWKKGDIYL